MIKRIAIASSLALAVIAFYALQPSSSKAIDQAATQWLPVEPQPLENQLGLIGRIEAATHLTLIAPFEGSVSQLSVAEGQPVERGQLLLTLDTSALEIQLRQAHAELLKAKRAVQDMQNWAHGEEVARARRAVNNAELNLSDTETKLNDTRRLFERGIVARMEVEALEQQLRLQHLDLAASQTELHAAQVRGQGENLQIAEMELANAQARHDSLATLQAQRELRAPFAGIVLLTQKNTGVGAPSPLHEGQPVSQGTPLLELASLERIIASARIEETDLHQLHENMPVQVTGDGFAGMTLLGKVLTIGAKALPSEAYGGGSTYEVKVAIDKLTAEQREWVRLGMSTRLAVVTYRTEKGIAVPAATLRQDENGNTYVIHRKSMSQLPRKIIVSPGHAVPQGVEVSGLEPGFVELPITAD